jgi:hypothetical protein
MKFPCLTPLEYIHTVHRGKGDIREFTVEQLIISHKFCNLPGEIDPRPDSQTYVKSINYGGVHAIPSA